MGGKPAPAVGWALGVDRVLELAKSHDLGNVGPTLDAYAIVTDVTAFPFVHKVMQELRELGLSVQMHASAGEGMGSMKSQFKRADSSGARFALIFGADEIATGQVTIKSLRNVSIGQKTLPCDQVIDWAATLQSSD